MKYFGGVSKSFLQVIAEPVTCREQVKGGIPNSSQRNSRRALTTQKGRAKWLCLVALCFAVVCEGAAAHAQSTFGSVIGTVQDPSGAVVPGASVHVKNMNDNTTRETRTNDTGEYLVLNLKSRLLLDHRFSG